MNDTPQNTALTVSDGQQPKPPAPKTPLTAGHLPRAIVPVDFEGAYRIANVVVQAGMAPKTLNTVEKAMVAILHGLEVGLTPMNALQAIAVINGRPTIWGDGAIGLIRASGYLEYMEEFYENEDKPNMKAVCVVKRKGEPKPVKTDFSMADAKTAGLLGKDGTWQTYPKRMLKMRARWALRDTFADVLKGLRLREEEEDIARSLATAEPERRRAPPPPPIENATAVADTVAAATSDEAAPATDESSGPATAETASDLPGDKAKQGPSAPVDEDIPWALDRKLSDNDRDWLMSLKEAFEQCDDIESLSAEQDSLMAPAKDSVSPYVWQKGVEVLNRNIKGING